MYLTTIPLVEGDDYKQHQNVQALFPGQKILFQQSDVGVMIFSSERPVNGDAKEIDLSSLSAVGTQHIFTLRLNPVKRDIKTRKRVPLENDLIKPWIEKQLNKIGAEVKFQYIKEGVRRSQKQSKIISLVSVLCFGTLKVTDQDKFKEVLRQGLSHGKGFGFGFLNIFM